MLRASNNNIKNSTCHFSLEKTCSFSVKPIEALLSHHCSVIWGCSVHHKGTGEQVMAGKWEEVGWDRTMCSTGPGELGGGGSLRCHADFLLQSGTSKERLTEGGVFTCWYLNVTVILRALETRHFFIFFIHVSHLIDSATFTVNVIVLNCQGYNITPYNLVHFRLCFMLSSTDFSWCYTVLCCQETSLNGSDISAVYHYCVSDITIL